MISNVRRYLRKHGISTRFLLMCIIFNTMFSGYHSPSTYVPNLTCFLPPVCVEPTLKSISFQIVEAVEEGGVVCLEMIFLIFERLF